MFFLLWAWGQLRRLAALCNLVFSFPHEPTWPLPIRDISLPQVLSSIVSSLLSNSSSRKQSQDSTPRGQLASCGRHFLIGPASPTSRECIYSQRFPKSQKGEVSTCLSASWVVHMGVHSPPFTFLASSSISWALKQMLPNKIKCSS